METFDTWYLRVSRLCDIEFELDEDVVENYKSDLYQIFREGVSPRRAANQVARKVFYNSDLK